jgi:hypothetical protein
MGRQKGSGTTGSLGDGECKVIVTLDVDTGNKVAGLRFVSQGKYLSFYADAREVANLVEKLKEVVKVLK